jgi:hypothetical protein
MQRALRSNPTFFFFFYFIYFFMAASRTGANSYGALPL